ncbi:MAG: hypothetical protein ABI175_01670, partial [Polyangiales bacterium]
MPRWPSVALGLSLRTATAVRVVAASALIVPSLVLVAGDAAAKKPADRRIAIYLEGPDAEDIGGDVVQALPEGLKVTNPNDFKDALAKAGQKGAMGKGLDSDKSKAKIAEKVRKAAEAEKIYATLIVRVSPGPKGQTKVKLVLLETDSDLIALDKEITIPAKGKKKAADWEKDRAALVADAVSEPLGKLVPEPEPEPVAKEEEPVAKEEPTTKDEAPEEPKGPRPKNDPAHSLFEIGAGVDVGFRSLTFDKPPGSTVRGYSVGGTPGVAIAAEVYPLAGSMNALGDIGLTVMYARALALQSAPAGGEKLSTSWSRYDLGLRYRIRTGDKLPIIGIGLGLGNETFAIDAAGSRVEGQDPSVSYRFLRVGLDLRMPFGSFAVFGGGNFLSLSAGGDVADRFPNTKLSGFDLFLGAGYMIIPGLEARVQGRYRKVSYTFGTNPVASAASESLSGLTIGAAY